MGGRIRCEMSQNAMSLLPNARVNRRPMVWREDHEDATAEAAARIGGAPSAVATNANATDPIEQPDDPDPRSVGEPDERIRGGRAQDQRDDGAR